MHTTLESVTDDRPKCDGLIYLVEDDRNQAATLLLLLTDTNYAVRRFAKLEDLLATLQGSQAPAAAIVLNTALNSDPSGGIAAISQLNQQLSRQLNQGSQTLPPHRIHLR